MGLPVNTKGKSTSIWRIWIKNVALNSEEIRWSVTVDILAWSALGYSWSRMSLCLLSRWVQRLVLCCSLTKAGEFAWWQNVQHTFKSISSSIFKTNQEYHPAFFCSSDPWFMFSHTFFKSVLLFHPADNQDLITISTIGNHRVEASVPLSLMQKCLWFWSILCSFLKHTWQIYL